MIKGVHCNYCGKQIDVEITGDGVKVEDCHCQNKKIKTAAYSKKDKRLYS